MNNPKDRGQFLKSGDWDAWAKSETDQVKKKPMPELQKGYPEGTVQVGLTDPGVFKVGRISFINVISKRASRRQYTTEDLTLKELSYLLWATQGIKKGNKLHRAVPSGGARHPFETYLSIHRVRDVRPGLYRYLPLEHRLLMLSEDDRLTERVTQACRDQKFAGQSAVNFIWTAIPYRTEWRYDTLSAKIIALDAGHLCENLYLASESIGCGTCAIGAYSQGKIDALLGVDGTEEFTVYIASVGKVIQ